MSSKAMSLKYRIKNYARYNNLSAQVVLQNYMFECFLSRLSKSKYHDKFVIKGGMLVAAIVGLDTRSTMDLDTTIRNLPLTSEQITLALNEIISIPVDDDVSFIIKSIEIIRKNDVYGGFCVRIDAIYDTILTPLSIDISTGDIITPSPIQYEFTRIFDKNNTIPLWGYNIETVLAEKLETILTRGIFTTRPRDFYDIYILATTQPYNFQTLHNALNATSQHRESTNAISNAYHILEQIKNSDSLKKQWKKYQNQFPYAKNIEYPQIMEVLDSLFNTNNL